MSNPYYFTNRNFKIGIKNKLDSHHNNHANSKLPFTPNFPEFGIEARYIIKIRKKLSVIHPSLLNQFKSISQTVLLTRFDKQDEDNQVLNETDVIFNLDVIYNLTESDLDKMILNLL